MDSFETAMEEELVNRPGGDRDDFKNAMVVLARALDRILDELERL